MNTGSWRDQAGWHFRHPQAMAQFRLPEPVHESPGQGTRMTFSAPTGLVDGAVAEVDCGLDQHRRNGRAVPCALDLEHAGIAVLDAQLVDLVVEHHLVAQGSSGKL